MNSSPPEENPQDSERKFSPQQLFLIGLLGVVFVIVIVVSILILNRPQAAAQPTPTEQPEILGSTDFVATLTPTNTISPSPGFTFTPKPTRTATIAPTLTVTPLPTLLPSCGLPFVCLHYSLCKLKCF